MSLEESDFFSLMGTIELVCELGEDGSRFSELEEELSFVMSHQTLITRIEQGKEAGIIESRTVSEGSSTSHKYFLTDIGSAYLDFLTNIGLESLYQDVKQVYKEFNPRREKAQRFLSEYPIHMYDKYGIEEHGYDIEYQTPTELWEAFLSGDIGEGKNE
jgi:DNA-binding HxlR family transcriptional regulator